ncbi:MAG: type II toxin-antitoxin system RelE/ParE family toxin [Chromatiales bacterium]|nr:MAG: type II toxin-antitoxin system RelE/ParE family toxin [Chromatiales bacterium]
MSIEVRLHPDAERELRSAYLWYLERSGIVASAFRAETDHAIQAITESPDRWPKLSELERRYVMPRFPFSLVYRKLPKYVEIIAVAHQKRRPDYWFRR